MKKTLIIAAVAALALVSCSSKDYKDSSLPVQERVQLLLKQMTLEEKVGQMCMYVGPCYVEPGHGSSRKNIDADDPNLGNPDIADKVRRGEVGSFLHVLTSEEANSLQKMAQESRLAIPLLIGVDAIHGSGLITGSTVYPTNIGMASTFHPEMMEKIGAETAEEMLFSGIHWTFAPNLDVARDARWGRIGETFGEDPYLVSQMGKYSIWGLQGSHDGYGPGNVMACAKHLIAGGEPAGGINAAPMDLSERKLRELFLPPFEVAVKEGHVGSVMAAHNEVNGIPCHGNKWILKDILRDELGFKGTVVSDWMDIERMHLFHHWLPSVDEAFKVSVEAGIDTHMQGPDYFESIIDGVKSGRIPMKTIDYAVGNILEAKFRLGLFENPVPELHASGTHPESIAEHRQTALEAARESIVLLKNDGILPLGKNPGRIFVCGPNADSQTILGDWVVPQEDDDVITALEGIKSKASNVQSMCFDGMIEHINDATIAEAARKARAADLNILVLGENSERYSVFGRTTGENCDRDNLDFPGRQEELLEAVFAAGKPTILVLLNGRPLSVVWAQKNVNAIVEAWEPGMLGGQAIAEILWGEVNPSGKLPVTIPWNEGQIPTVYNYKPMQYSRHFVWTHTGYLYPFGFGLSYTTYEYGEPRLEGDVLSVDVTNTGGMDGTEVVQLYVHDEYASVTRPVKELKAFKRVEIKSGQTVTVDFTITPEMLQCWGAEEKWAVEPGDFTLLVGPSSEKKALKGVTYTVE